MLRRNRTYFSPIIIVLAMLGLILVLGSVPGLAGAASEKSPILISLDVKEMDLQDVLRLITEKADVNIIAGREVTGTVTLRLRNVDLWQALKAVLEVCGFTYLEEEGIIRIIKLEETIKEKPILVTEVILLKYAKVEEIKKISQHLLSSSGTISIDDQTNALIINDISQNIEKVREVVAKLDTEPLPVLGKRRFQLNYIDTRDENKKSLLENALSSILGEEGNFFIDSLTNAVYVEAPSSCIEKVKEYFEGLDVRRKRIMIKAEFVEVRLSAGEELGIKWRWKGAYENYPLGATFDYPYYARPEPGEKVPEPRAPLSTLAAGLGIIFGSVEQEFRGIIDLLIFEGKAHLISSPNIVTLEDQEAEIDVVDEYPYETYVIEEGVKETVIKFKGVGATLLVTPHIEGEKRIILNIEPEVSEITGSPPFVGAPPIVGTRKAKTQIAVDDGDTIVIGGLLRETEKETRAGVPFLSRLPIIGSLFTYKTTEKEKTDLLIFITPYILPEKMEEENIIEKRRPTKVEIEEIYQKGLNYKKNGEYEKARESFEEVMKKSVTYGFSDYLTTAEKELVELERLEKKKLEKEKREAIGLGEWFSCSGTNSFMIYEAQLRLKDSLRLFSGGGGSSDQTSYVSYLGIRTGDKLNFGAGIIKSDSFEGATSFFTAGFSLETDRVRLESNYFYMPENQDVNGIRVMLGIEF